MSSIDLYKKLLEDSKEHLLEFTKNFPRNEKQFNFEKFNEIAFNKMYKNNSKIIPRHNFFEDIPNLKNVCSDCWKFYLSPRNRSLKFMDIKLGKVFENQFKKFLISLGFHCYTIDELGLPKNYPDLVVVDDKNKPLVFLEMKYLTAPFVFVHKKVPGRECYEGSTTLDADEKLEKQRAIITQEIDVPSFYVYWIDYPCIKGIFFMDSKEVFSYYKEKETEWVREARKGDFVQGSKGKVRVGHMKKIYLPLLQMGDFAGLVKVIQETANNQNGS